MIQDISPKQLVCEYHEYDEGAEDFVICIWKGKLLVSTGSEQEPVFPTEAGLLSNELFFKAHEESDFKFPVHYLFQIDGRHYVLWALNNELMIPGFEYKTMTEIRVFGANDKVMAAATAWHLYNWYTDNCFCGRCGKKLVHDGKLRMLSCECGNQVFPRIAPAVIVGVIKGDEILITRYAGRTYKKNALIAGFTEIGETAEETVAREVMEEVGIKVKNIRYYKSQPWGFTGTLLLGFFCEADGDTEITMDENELSEAVWVKRADLPEYTEGLSLTGEMMNVFKGQKL